MKIALLTLFILMISLPIPAIAETKSNKSRGIEAELAEEAGILPTSFWYWADIYAEELKFSFSFGVKSKIKYLEKVKAERESEIRLLDLRGDDRYEEHLLEKKEAMEEMLSGMKKKLEQDELKEIENTKNEVLEVESKEVDSDEQMNDNESQQDSAEVPEDPELTDDFKKSDPINTAEIQVLNTAEKNKATIKYQQSWWQRLKTNARVLLGIEED